MTIHCSWQISLMFFQAGKSLQPLWLGRLEGHFDQISLIIHEFVHAALFFVAEMNFQAFGMAAAAFNVGTVVLSFQFSCTWLIPKTYLLAMLVCCVALYGCVCKAVSGGICERDVSGKETLSLSGDFRAFETWLLKK